MPVNKIDAADVLRALTPIWHRRPKTGNRVRVRTGAVLRWAIAEGHRGDDPTEAVREALPRNGNGGEKRHNKAVAHAHVAEVLRVVRGGKKVGCMVGNALGDRFRHADGDP